MKRILALGTLGSLLVALGLICYFNHPDMPHSFSSDWMFIKYWLNPESVSAKDFPTGQFNNYEHFDAMAMGRWEDFLPSLLVTPVGALMIAIALHKAWPNKAFKRIRPLRGRSA